MKYIVFLQNAWSPLYAGGTWPRRSWLKALARSRSGQRLKIIVKDDFDLCENTTPIVGESADSVMPPDTEYIKGIINRRKPEAVVACGKQAEKAISELWHGPLIITPHPAYRVLRNSVYEKVGDLLLKGFNGKLLVN
jgi:hypothetical protein